MKKLISFALTLTLVFSLSVTAFATSDTTELNTGHTSGNTQITYNVDPAYTVTIPTNVELTDKEAGTSALVKATNVKIPRGENLTVKLDMNNTFQVSTPSGNNIASLKYTVTKDDNSNNSLNAGDEIFSFSPYLNDEKSVIDFTEATLKFNLDTSTPVTYAGNYSGTLTFTVSVDPIEATEQP